MVTPTIFLLAINCKKKNVLSLILLELQKRKNRQMLCEGLAFGRFLRFKTPRVLKIEHFFFLQLIANKKNSMG